MAYCIWRIVSLMQAACLFCSSLYYNRFVRSSCRVGHVSHVGHVCHVLGVLHRQQLSVLTNASNMNSFHSFPRGVKVSTNKMPSPGGMRQIQYYVTHGKVYYCNNRCSLCLTINPAKRELFPLFIRGTSHKRVECLIDISFLSVESLRVRA